MAETSMAAVGGGMICSHRAQIWQGRGWCCYTMGSYHRCSPIDKRSPDFLQALERDLGTMATDRESDGGGTGEKASPIPVCGASGRLGRSRSGARPIAVA
jgi:hypothetical protein